MKITAPLEKVRLFWRMSAEETRTEFCIILESIAVLTQQSILYLKLFESQNCAGFFRKNRILKKDDGGFPFQI